MIKNIISNLLFIIVLSGCTNSVKEILISKVNQECDNSTSGVPCTIMLKDLTKFKWDKMYIFPDWTTSDSIAKTIGFYYNGNDVQDDYSRMLFTDGSKIIYEEDFVSLDYNSSTIKFPELSDSLRRARLHYLTPSEAIFTVGKDKIKGSCRKCFIYSFVPIKK